jgi:hypothetical protein
MYRASFLRLRQITATSTNQCFLNVSPSRTSFRDVMFLDLTPKERSDFLTQTENRVIPG